MRCEECGERFVAETWWDEKGFGYSAKLTKCPICGCIQYVKIVEDPWLDVNGDERYYEYRKREE